VTLPHNLICEAGIHYLRVKLKAEGAHRDTSYPLRRYIRCCNGNSWKAGHPEWCEWAEQHSLAVELCLDFGGKKSLISCQRLL